MPLNICILKPYLWLAASLGQSLPATPFLQHLAKLCPCYLCLLGEYHLSDHPHYSEPFGGSELTFFSSRSWHLCLDCNLYRKLHFVCLMLWLTSTGYAGLGSPSTLIWPPCCAGGTTRACQCGDGHAEHFKPGFTMLQCEATEVLPAFFMRIDPSCAGNVKVCKASYKQRT